MSSDDIKLILAKLDALEAKVQDMEDHVDRRLRALERQALVGRGALWVLLGLGGIAMTVGGWLVPYIFPRP